MAHYKSNKGLYVSIFFLACVIGFLSVSIYLAHIHDNGLVTEWQTWFGIVKQTKEVIDTPIQATQTILIS